MSNPSDDERKKRNRDKNRRYRDRKRHALVPWAADMPSDMTDEDARIALLRAGWISPDEIEEPDIVPRVFGMILQDNLDL